jgi:hypothetical protein
MILSVFFMAKFCLISTWKIRFQPKFKGILIKEIGPNSPDFERIFFSESSDFYDKSK